VPPLLEIDGLAVRHAAGGAPPVVALEEATLQVAEGETVGVLGESGSGKTTLIDAVLGLLPPGASVAGAIRFRGEHLLALPERERRKRRGAGIGLVPQDPVLALTPVRRAGPQVAEIVAAHRGWDRKRCRAEAEAALASVGLSPATYDAYPHELSGGQRQRVTIAQALCCRPALLLADEPTAALDTVTQAELRALLRGARRAHGVAMLLVSHDVGALAALADRIVVLHGGRTVEGGPTAQVLRAPRHARTRALLESVPRPAPRGLGPGAADIG
jgi:ABC-type glutathione transport system ATPase component